MLLQSDSIYGIFDCQKKQLNKQTFPTMQWFHGLFTFLEGQSHEKERHYAPDKTLALHSSICLKTLVALPQWPKVGKV